MWKSPNGTIRAILDGTVFRAPILHRHDQAGGDATGKSPSPSPVTPTATSTRPWSTAYPRARASARMTFTRRERQGAVPLDHRSEGRRSRPSSRAMHNKDASIRSFARCLLSSMPSTRSRTCGSPPRTPSPRSTTGTFKLIFQEDLRRRSYKAKFEAAGPDLFLHPHRRRGRARHPQRAAASSGPARTTTAT